MVAARILFLDIIFEPRGTGGNGPVISTQRQFDLFLKTVNSVDPKTVTIYFPQLSDPQSEKEEKLVGVALK